MPETLDQEVSFSVRLDLSMATKGERSEALGWCEIIVQYL